GVKRLAMQEVCGCGQGRLARGWCTAGCVAVCRRSCCAVAVRCCADLGCCAIWKWRGVHMKRMQELRWRPVVRWPMALAAGVGEGGPLCRARCDAGLGSCAEVKAGRSCAEGREAYKRTPESSSQFLGFDFGFPRLLGSMFCFLPSVEIGVVRHLEAGPFESQEAPKKAFLRVREQSPQQVGIGDAFLDVPATSLSW
ncbi:hypothetical protein Taro_056094, partial [Colocasia esculenta]|nr:hypothetical protein [Colocasia esculenta]